MGSPTRDAWVPGPTGCKPSAVGRSPLVFLLPGLHLLGGRGTPERLAGHFVATKAATRDEVQMGHPTREVTSKLWGRAGGAGVAMPGPSMRADQTGDVNTPHKVSPVDSVLCQMLSQNHSQSSHSSVSCTRCCWHSLTLWWVDLSVINLTREVYMSMMGVSKCILRNSCWSSRGDLGDQSLLVGWLPNGGLDVQYPLEERQNLQSSPPWKELGQCAAPDCPHRSDWLCWFLAWAYLPPPCPPPQIVVQAGLSQHARGAEGQNGQSPSTSFDVNFSLGGPQGGSQMPVVAAGGPISCWDLLLVGGGVSGAGWGTASVLDRVYRLRCWVELYSYLTSGGMLTIWTNPVDGPHNLDFPVFVLLTDSGWVYDMVLCIGQGKFP